MNCARKHTLVTGCSSGIGRFDRAPARTGRPSMSTRGIRKPAEWRPAARAQRGRRHQSLDLAPQARLSGLPGPGFARFLTPGGLASNRGAWPPRPISACPKRPLIGCECD